jgi:hypothetical protein
MAGQSDGASPLILFGRKGESQVVRVLSMIVGSASPGAISTEPLKIVEQEIGPKR